jgi:hypothetical protein
MHKLLLNPFIYPGPVPVDKFVGREEEINSLLNRIATGQNTAVVGEPHIGKSSLLKCLAESEDCRARLGNKAAKTLFVFLDCHLLPSNFTPTDFWGRNLAVVSESCSDKQVRDDVNLAERDNFSIAALDKLFRTVTDCGWLVALLIDEFDRMLDHRGFNTADFFGALRALSQLTGLAVVTTSRLSVKEMNQEGLKLARLGSPFFNGLLDVNLRPFDDNDVNALLEKALAGTDVTFDARDRDFLHSMAGGHPFLLQAAAGALYDAIVSGKQNDARYYQAGRVFYRQTEDHFSDFWHRLDPKARTAVTILCLAELQGRAPGQSFDIRDIGSLERFETQLSSLAEQGLVELWKEDGWHADWGSWVFWRGERWRVTNRRLVWWVSDQVLAREQVDWEEWLDTKRYHGPLTAEEIETVKAWKERMPKGVISTVDKIIGLLLRELLAAAH